MYASWIIDGALRAFFPCVRSIDFRASLTTKCAKKVLDKSQWSHYDSAAGRQAHTNAWPLNLPVLETTRNCWILGIRMHFRVIQLVLLDWCYFIEMIFVINLAYCTKVERSCVKGYFGISLKADSSYKREIERVCCNNIAHIGT